MNAEIKEMLIDFHRDLASLEPEILLAVIDLLAMDSVDSFITKNPLPVGVDLNEMRGMMLLIRIAEAVKRVKRILDKMAQQPADRPPSPQDEAIAKDAADAAIAKALGKLN